ncbi:DUF1223 domain-containing protein [Roseivivax marinus]|uniref:DUF1223 domain-containing protein n=1 Tax=Roseivivax marinus TaxID=1379903 RepID=UPI001F044EC3|nr:DUF1223 domain-containing protein [Roseivivax marinus]UMA66268.1 DUF1223 domain-containing protein [Roseivivax marinus]
MPLRAAWIVALSAGLCGTTAMSGERPVVVELFTSQGCSSCPPADELLETLGSDADVIPLALHVDYWDYIGWKDSFAQARFTKRQKAYAKAAGRHTIYTPQMVVNGTEDVVGTRPKDVAALIAEHRAAETPVALDVSRSSDMLTVRVSTETPVGPSVIYLVRYEPDATVRVRRGENAGRTLDYTHIVTDWDMIGRWDGHSAFSESQPMEGDAPAVVLVQEDGYGPILSAARLR